MWERLPIAAAFLFVAFLGIGSCWLMWRKSKDRKERRSKPDFSCLTEEERSVLDDWHGLPKPYQQTYRPDYVPAPKDKREQIDIDRRIEHIPMVKIPPLDLERMKRRIMNAIKLEMRKGKHYLTTGGQVKVLQMPQERKDIEPCKRERGCSRRS